MLREKYSYTRICTDCVEEPDLRDYIASADGEPGCSFCNEDDAPTCAFLEVMDHVVKGGEKPDQRAEQNTATAAVGVRWSEGVGIRLGAAGAGNAGRA